MLDRLVLRRRFDAGLCDEHLMLEHDDTRMPEQRRWITWLSPGITLAVLAAALWQLRTLQPRALLAILPHTAAFWLVFLADYALAPAADYVIFRHLWQVPAAAFPALVRKMISNQLVASYVGEAHFYAWARARAGMVMAPFAAIKDVAMLSALAGNVTTLLLLLAATPLLRTVPLGVDLHLLPLSGAFVLLSSSMILVLRKSLFSLPRADLARVSAIHAGRLVLHIGLVALAWHLALPGQDVRLWLILSALAMLLSRLPFVPNSGLVLAGLAALLIGHDAEVTRLLTMMAGLTIATHMVVGLPLFAGEMRAWRR